MRPAATLLVLPMLVLAALAGAVSPTAQGQDHLSAFGSEQALAHYLLRLAEGRPVRAVEPALMPFELSPQAITAPPATATDPTGESIALLAPGAVAITNVQSEGVDEGGIVKRAGDYFVILRRGRLFSVRATGDELRPVAAVDAFGPGISPQGTWYDEMLVSSDTIVVIGYSYARTGTEIGLFRLDPDGGIHYLSTHQLRSGDYFSAQNYASRLIGDTLIFYSALPLRFGEPPRASVPALRRWGKGATEATPFEPITRATQVYRSGLEALPGDLSLHSVTRCRIRGGDLTCSAQAVLGPESRVFYVAADAAYVWMTAWDAVPEGAVPPAAVLRMPLDGSPPQSLRVSGGPVDQMSFLERDGYLNVLVGSDGKGDAMFDALAPARALALLRVPLSAFGGARARATRANYRRLPGSDTGWMANRYVGNWLLYGADDAEGDPEASRGIGVVHVLRYASAGPLLALSLGHGVERIEALGRDALVVGSHQDALSYTPVRLNNASARTATPYVQPGARQAEGRTHGFFYHREGEHEGVLGLPVLGTGSVESASVTFLRNLDLVLRPLGELAGTPGHGADDACRASCLDWYGNARPIFVGDRAYALLGYELVEGRVRPNGVDEVRRVDFRPAAPQAVTH